ncbi:unnamed protein product [Miscanthus lutarioriparius]|uniref:Phosphatidic acid phosphatase type 2/haloperoxidase domain-containing protein n=1 Tax=Miscanthus lutarioriparius TaxID=422564 RepID=A0A811PJN4_9POAL|nr:unnamed protein product [Miscanthus lutarioriparius]
MVAAFAERGRLREAADKLRSHGFPLVVETGNWVLRVGLRHRAAASPTLARRSTELHSPPAACAPTNAASVRSSSGAAGRGRFGCARPGVRRWPRTCSPGASPAIWKHDAEIMWFLLGAVGNSLLSMVLKKMLNHERPAAALRSDPGMPSSHAQSIFYAATILALSLYYWLGTNYLTMILGPATLSAAAYLSWLRVSQRLHTLNQVTVGAVVGSAFGALWFVLWHSLVQEAFASSLLVRIAVIVGSSSFCVSFVIYMIRHWLKDE